MSETVRVRNTRARKQTLYAPSQTGNEDPKGIELVPGQDVEVPVDDWKAMLDSKTASGVGARAMVRKGDLLVLNPKVLKGWKPTDPNALPAPGATPAPAGAPKGGRGARGKVVEAAPAPAGAIIEGFDTMAVDEVTVALHDADADEAVLLAHYGHETGKPEDKQRVDIVRLLESLIETKAGGTGGSATKE